MNISKLAQPGLKSIFFIQFVFAYFIAVSIASDRLFLVSRFIFCSENIFSNLLDVCHIKIQNFTVFWYKGPKFSKESHLS